LSPNKPHREFGLGDLLFTENNAKVEIPPKNESRKMTKYVKHLTNDELLQRLADELVRTHRETGIDLGYWETAREVVERFYNVEVELTITKKKKAEKK
jgi:hypothetical protein